MDLNELRGEIDRIDEELLRLYCRRMEIVGEVARFKAQNHLPVYHPQREKEIISTMAARAGEEHAGGAKVLFETLMDISKSYQRAQLSSPEETGALYREITAALAAPQPVPEAGTVACQGVPGAYSHEAALRLFQSPDIRFIPQFEDVFAAVERGECAFGVLPIENSSAGSVGAVYDLMRRYRFYICKSYTLTVRHALLACAGASLAGITDVYSHQQGLSQCSDFLRANPQITPHVYSNTAAAAKYVAGLQSPGAAAISPPGCAALYGLTPLKQDLQNAKNNFTRFIVISRRLLLPPGAGKISLSLTLPHVAGSLYRLITRFAVNSLNLTKLESRPLPDTDFEFLFYFDFEGSVRDPQVLRLLCELSGELAHFEFLGNY